MKQNQLPRLLTAINSLLGTTFGEDTTELEAVAELEERAALNTDTAQENEASSSSATVAPAAENDNAAEASDNAAEQSTDATDSNDDATDSATAEEIAQLRQSLEALQASSAQTQNTIRTMAATVTQQHQSIQSLQTEVETLRSQQTEMQQAAQQNEQSTQTSMADVAEELARLTGVVVNPSTDSADETTPSPVTNLKGDQAGNKGDKVTANSLLKNRRTGKIRRRR